MNRGDPNRLGDRVVFWVCVISTLILYTHLVWEDGYAAGKNLPKQCAKVPGKEVVSSTADTCTYANSFGRSTTKRRAG
jgi:hypothetical protein